MIREPGTGDSDDERRCPGDGMAASLVGVGVGPGDPELITVRSLRVLREADRVFGPTSVAATPGRAESIVRAADPTIPVERLLIDMHVPSYEAPAETLCRCLDQGERVACVTLGDPNVYSTFSSLARAVLARRPQTQVATVPGIMAFQELAARAGITLLEGAERLTLLTALDGLTAFDHAFEAALDQPDTAVVVYKGGGHLPTIAKQLAVGERGDAGIVGELLGLPGERIGPTTWFATRPANYLSTVIVPPRRRAGKGDPGTGSPSGSKA